MAFINFYLIYYFDNYIIYNNKIAFIYINNKQNILIS